MSYCPTCGNANGVHWQGCQTSAEHTNPEQSLALLRAELDACRGLLDLRAEIIRQLWPETLESRSVGVGDDEGVIRRLEWDGVLSEEAAGELRRIVGLS